jgi:hypothetical protein
MDDGPRITCMRSLVDWDLASILVLLSSSVMDDGPRAKSRFDWDNTIKPNHLFLLYYISQT